jgi:hypothetical protein
MDFTELRLEGVEWMNVRSPFLSNMALGDLGRRFRGSLVISFSVAEMSNEENILYCNFRLCRNIGRRSAREEALYYRFQLQR